MTDFRSLCVELVDELENWIAYGDEADIADAHMMVDRARAALAQPQTSKKELTDEQLLKCFKIATPCYNMEGWKRELDGMRAAIAADRALCAELQGLTDEEILRIAAKTIEPYETCGIALGEYEAETECAVEVYGSELIAFARAIVAELRGQDQQKQTENQS